MRISDWSSDVCPSGLPDGWPNDDEQDGICQRVDSMAVREHYQAWSQEVQEKLVSLFSHRLQSTAELRAKLEEANSLLSDWLNLGNNMDERRANRDRARHYLASLEDRKNIGSGQQVSVQVDVGGRHINKQKTDVR